MYLWCIQELGATLSCFFWSVCGIQQSASLVQLEKVTR